MSIQIKRSLVTCFFVVAFGFAVSASAEDRIVNGSFSDGTAGSAPASPWDIKVKNPSPDATVTLATLPESTDSKLWVCLSDLSNTTSPKLSQSFSPIEKGRLTLKLYFKKDTDSPGCNLYLSNGKAHVIDLKISKGGVRVDVGDKKIKTKFKFTPGTVYPVFCDFRPSEDGTKLDFEIGTDDAGKIESIYKGQAERQSIDSFRIITDTENNSTVVYVTDISLVAKE